MHLDPDDISKFVKLDGVTTLTATPSETFIANVKKHGVLGYKGLQHLKEFMAVKGAQNPIALVGGGPSLKKELDKIREFKFYGFPIVACGSSHDYLVKHNIIPDYCTVCDPDEIMVEYLKYKNPNTKYLIALSCHDNLFEHLKDNEVYVWNCRSDECADEVKDIVEKIGYVDIYGGCTVGLRSISISMVLGYTNIHLWGFDSCMGSGDLHHAYKFETDKEQVGTLYPIRYGVLEDGPDPEEKYYFCSGYQLAQAVHFHKFLEQFGAAFTPTFHGDGLLRDLYIYLRKQAEIEAYKLRNSQINLDNLTSNMEAA